MRYFTLTILFILMLGCQKSVEKFELTESRIIETDSIKHIDIKIPSNREKLSISKLLDTAYLVPLGRNQNLVIGEILQVEYYQNQFYILDNSQDQKLYIFSQNGDLIRTIGSMGNGPEEFTSAQKFHINRFNKYVDVVDGLSQEITRYGLDGQFISKHLHGIHLQEITSLTDSSYAIFTSKRLNFIPNESNTGVDSLMYDIIYTDLNFQPTGYQFPFRFQDHQGFYFWNITHFNYFNKQPNLMIPLSKTIQSFNLKTGQFEPIIRIRHDQEPEPSLYSTPRNEVKEIISERPTFAYFTSQYWEVNSTIFFEYAYAGYEYIVLANQLSNQVFSGIPVNDFFGFFPNIYCVTNDAFVGVVSSDELILLLENYNKSPNNLKLIKDAGGVESIKGLQKLLNTNNSTTQFLAILKP